MSAKYMNFSIYLEKLLVDGGFTKANGAPNIQAFFEQWGKGVDGISQSTFQNMVKGPKHEPHGRSLDALAVMLSNATGTKITPDFLLGLCRSPESVASRRQSHDPSMVPDDFDRHNRYAEELFADFQAMTLDARSHIAPLLLDAMAKDFQYQRSDDHGRIAILIKMAVERRGVGLEVWREQDLQSVIDADTMARLRDGDRSVVLKPRQLDKLVSLLRLGSEPVSPQDFSSLLGGD